MVGPRTTRPAVAGCPRRRRGAHARTSRCAPAPDAASEPSSRKIYCACRPVQRTPDRSGRAEFGLRDAEELGPVADSQFGFSSHQCPMARAELFEWVGVMGSPPGIRVGRSCFHGGSLRGLDVKSDRPRRWLDELLGQHTGAGDMHAGVAVAFAGSYQRRRIGLAPAGVPTAQAGRLGRQSWSDSSCTTKISAFG